MKFKLNMENKSAFIKGKTLAAQSKEAVLQKVAHRPGSAIKPRVAQSTTSNSDANVPNRPFQGVSSQKTAQATLNRNESRNLNAHLRATGSTFQSDAGQIRSGKGGAFQTMEIPSQTPQLMNPDRSQKVLHKNSLGNSNPKARTGTAATSQATQNPVKSFAGTTGIPLRQNRQTTSQQRRNVPHIQTDKNLLQGTIEAIVQTGGSVTQTNKRYRVAMPLQNTPNSVNPHMTNQSSAFWNQVSHQIANPRTSTKNNNLIITEMAGSQQTDVNFQDLLRRKHQLQYNENDVEHLNSKKFQFFSCVGGKLLVHDKISVNAKMDETLADQVERSISPISVDKKMAIYTQMSVDQHDFEIRQRRTIYLQQKAQGQKPDKLVQIAQPTVFSNTFQRPQTQKPFAIDPAQEQMAETLQRPMSTHQLLTNPSKASLRQSQKELKQHRPISGISHLKKSAKQPFKINDDDIYNDTEFIKEEGSTLEKSDRHGTEISSFCKQIFQARPTTALITNAANAEDNLPFPELFDRSERTFAATFARYGDLSYFTPIQRIGAYMEYASRLKRRHLLDLIAYLKTSKTQVKLEDDLNRPSEIDYMEHCLFVGLMPEEEKTDGMMGATLFNQDLQFVWEQNWRSEKPKVPSYDPVSSKPTLELHIEKLWQKALLRQVDVSVKRVLHYIEDPESIRSEELSKYRKDWMQNSLDLVPENLLIKFPDPVKQLFQEIFESYVKAMKIAIMEYILRSPDERKRLHILMLPKVIFTATERQARYGGYSIKLHPGTHKRVVNSLSEIKYRLLINNIVSSTLLGWWHEFRNFKLVDLKNFHAIVQAKNDALLDSDQEPLYKQTTFTIDIDNFLAYQEAHTEKVLAIFNYIWHRGAILIVKKFKVLRMKEQLDKQARGYAAHARWSFKGYQPNGGKDNLHRSYYGLSKQAAEQMKTFEYEGGQTKESRLSPYQKYCMRMAYAHSNVPLKMFRSEDGFSETDNFEALFEDNTLDQLLDIRDNPAFIVFTQMIGGYINFEENGYSGLTKDYKRELKYASGNLMKLQLRQTIEASITTLSNFFRGTKTLQSLKRKEQIEPMRALRPTQTIYREADMLSLYQKAQEGKFDELSKAKIFERYARQMQNKKQKGVAKKEAPVNKLLAEQLKKRNEKSEGSQEMKKATDDSSAFYEKTPTLGTPDFMDLQDFCNPIFRLELLLGRSNVEAQLSEELVFNKSDFEIIESFDDYIENMIVAFNKFTRPEFTKVLVYSKKKYEVDLQEQEANRKLQMNQLQGPRQRRSRDSATLQSNKNVSGKGHLGTAIKQGVYSNDLAKVINPLPVDFDSFMYSGEYKGPFTYERYMGRIKIRYPPENVLKREVGSRQAGSVGKTQAQKLFQQETVNRYMTVATSDEEFFKMHKAKILNVLRDHLLETKRVQEVFVQFMPIITKQLRGRVDKFLREPGSALDKRKEYTKMLQELRYYQNLIRQLPQRVAFPMFEVGLLIVKNELRERIEVLITQVLRKFENDLRLRTDELIDEFDIILKTLSKVSETPEDVVEMETYKSNLLLDLSKLQRDLDFQKQCTFFLLIQNDMPNIFEAPKDQPGHVQQEDTTFEAVMNLHAWPNILNTEMDRLEGEHIKQRHTVEVNTEKKKQKLISELQELILKTQKERRRFVDLRNTKKYIETLIPMNDYLDILKERRMEVNQDEFLLFGSKSEFKEFTVLAKELEPHVELWQQIYKMTSKEKLWFEHCQLSQVDADEVEQLIKESDRSHMRLMKSFEGNMDVQRILQQMKDRINDLRNHLPVIEALCNKALKPRHWEQIQLILGIQHFDIVTYRLNDLLTTPELVKENLKQLIEISDKAKKQDRLEDMLVSMESEWKNLTLDITVFRETKILIFQGIKIEEMQALLDEHVLISQQIKNSPEIGPVQQRADSWVKTMLFLQEVLEIWTKLQGNFLYLWPIFNSVGIQDDVKSLLQVDDFAEVEKTWNHLMAVVKKKPNALSLEGIPNLEKLLKESDNALEKIQKNLNQYLESKRRFFPRFYFLSNEDLIEILGDSQKPKKIQKHLKKCFEGINEVGFQPSIRKLEGDDEYSPIHDEIVSIISKEKEKVPLVQAIMPAFYDGKVEEWLMELENQMKESVKKVITDSLKDYKLPKTMKKISNSQIQYPDRTNWLKKWQSQVILLVSQINWTEQVEECFSTKFALGKLQDLHKESEAMLNQIVDMVRGQLDDLQRLTLSSLIVMEVHAKDVIESLINERVMERSDFGWIQHLRYYYKTGGRNDQKVSCEMISTELAYCNEYLGNTTRLVITTLTDRCYRTLMSALQLNLGGAPEGPAGTGKTETTKDLAKAIGVHCIVFNCAEGLKASAMAKFFKGLVSAGSWSCFDEFNRIELEVLSVIAQQVHEIQKAKNSNKKEFFFEDSMVNLQPTANIFITMNPGYAGRAELPDNLKALFRPVAMMIPDYTMIAEISLYSFGFFESRTLSKKIVATYRLCSEQLSSQYHYDYGMRAVKSVLTAAKNLKYQVTKNAKNADSPLDEREEALILKSIRDVNLPKFLAEDIPLFMGIIGDLFPDLKLQDSNYSSLQTCMESAMDVMNLQPEPTFTEKVIQLYEMIKCRHGLMLVGPANSGKTTTYRVLQSAITKVCSLDAEMEELPVETYIINPKSVTINELYGSYDLISQEFTNGIIGTIFKRCVNKDPEGARKWIVFDGPVDADWIENMNTVLDDNKKLCLLNGEVIQMSDSMNMVFETHDLSQASLATVSRCGMVYLAQSSFGGWPTLLKSWERVFFEKANLQSVKTHEHALFFEHVELLFEKIWFFIDDFVLRKAQTMLKMTSTLLMANMLRILTVLVQDAFFQETIHLEKIKFEQIKAALDQIFLFAIIWSAGAIITEHSWKEFEALVRQKQTQTYALEKNKTFRIERSAQIPELGQSISSFFLSEGKWTNWRDQLNTVSDFGLMLDDTDISEMIVPTTENLKQGFILKLLLSKDFPTLFVGPTGTGKSVAVQKYLRSLDQDPEKKTLSCTICFSAKSSASGTLNYITEHLEKRGRKTLAPPVGKKMLIFLDDLNMPVIEKYGAQPPIELLRQFLDHQSWYILKEAKNNLLFELNDITLIGSMAPPTGGQNAVTPRFVRHFNIIACNNFEEHVLSRIFNKLIDRHVAAVKAQGDTEKTLRAIVEGSIDIFFFAQKELRPTPAKSHYLFNLRDLSRVIQGIVMVKEVRKNKASQMLLRLWVHEVGRVFADRLISTQDQQLLFSKMLAVSKDKMREDLVGALKELDPENKMRLEGMHALEKSCITMMEVIKFSDFAVISSSRDYEEILIGNKPQMVDAVKNALDNYNNTNQKRMDLVLFDFAIMHLLRICRVLRMNRGNILLVGVGGSGRQSLTRLAVFIQDHQQFQIEPTKSYGLDSWIEDMKRLLMIAGYELKTTCFLLSDSQIKHSFMLEDVNNLLNTSEIPGLLGPDDKIVICEKMRLTAKKEGRLDLFNTSNQQALVDFFGVKVRAHLHVALAMSPTGSNLADKIRSFPSLVNCCTIDWFTPWPEEALEAVAKYYLNQMPFDKKDFNNIVKVCRSFHFDAHSIKQKFLEETNRFTYITPTSYLDLLQIFIKLLDTQRTRVFDKKNSYENGINKLEETKAAISVMQDELNEQKPKLEQMNEETDELMHRIEKSSFEVVEPKKRQIMAEEEEANEVAYKAQLMKSECENDLSRAIPLLQAAQKALSTLKASDIVECKSMKAPPNTVKLVLHAVCVMCERQVEKTPMKDNPKKKEENWWQAGTKFMNENNFLDQLINIDKDNMKESVIEKIRAQFLGHEDFNPARVAKASVAAKGLCEWVIRLEQYHRVIVVIKPKREALAEAEQKYREKMTELSIKQEELHQVVMEFEKLQTTLRETQDKKIHLRNQIEECQTKLERAETLLSGLGGEKLRWKQAKLNAEESLATILPDCLLSSGIIAYLGPYTQTYRHATISGWKRLLLENHLKTAFKFSLESIVGDQILISAWHGYELPTDRYSVENGLIMTQSQKWPLFIDPQGQANKWIKRMESKVGEPNEGHRNLIVLKPSDSDFVQRFTQAIRMGMPLILESVGEEVDPILEPVLLKQVFKVAGSKQIRFGDDIIDYADEFRLYMTTRLSNPHFLPELSTKVVLINFMITFEGLQAQLLNRVVRLENERLDEERARLIMTQHENNKQLKDLELKILKVLKDSKGNILDDESAIEVLKDSQNLSDQIQAKQVEAIETEQRLEEARMAYNSIANHSALLFFLVFKLSLVDVMYQNSLQWFIQLFEAAVVNSRVAAQKPEGEIDNSSSADLFDQDIAERLETLRSYFTESLYSNVCRSIFEKDKLLFSFLLTVTIRQAEGKISETSYRLLTANMTGLENPLNLPNPTTWMPTYVWNKLCQYAEADGMFDLLVRRFKNEEKQWKELFDCENLSEDLFPKMSAGLMWPEFQRLLLLKAIRPDKLGEAIKQYVVNEMGPYFLHPPPFELEESFRDSTSSTPLIFVLPGADPQKPLQIFAASKKKHETLKIISLGQGQGIKAEKAIAEARKQGSWVLLQNCHLYPSWMQKLEIICEQLEVKKVGNTLTTHTGFRLWLTSYPSASFPTAVLQNGIKMTNEPPLGMKSNMMGSYNNAEVLGNPKYFEHNQNPATFKKLAFGMTMCHAILQQRCSFGSLGWNNLYQFTLADLEISLHQLNSFVNEHENVPYNALQYMIGECNYGGRVTDEQDRRVLHAIVKDFMNDHVILVPNFSFIPEEQSDFYVLPHGEHPKKVYTEKIANMPTVEKPTLFGFHANADITKNLNMSKQILGELLMIGEVEGLRSEKNTGSQESLFEEASKESQGTKRTEANASSQSPTEKLCLEILAKLPRDAFNEDAVNEVFPVNYNNSMNTVIAQEVVRYNRLFRTIQSSLQDLILAQKGDVLYTESLQKINSQLLLGQVPDAWMRMSYPNVRPLALYIQDFSVRLMFLQNWIDMKGPPTIFWISGFFFTQSFLTAILQNYARKYHIEIDMLHFEFKFLHYSDPTDYKTEVFSLMKAQKGGLDVNEPKDGALISGLFFEGCAWDFDELNIVEQGPKQLYSRVPVIHLAPVKMNAAPTASDKEKKKQYYNCPVYKTPERRGTLSTTGHSTNFIVMVKTPLADKPDDDSEDFLQEKYGTISKPEHWVKRGAAILCQELQ